MAIRLRQALLRRARIGAPAAGDSHLDTTSPPESPPAKPFEGLLLVGLFALPMVMGVISRLAMGAWWFNDLDAVFCGAWRVAHGHSAYAQGLACPGGHPAAYVYLPQLANVLAPLASGPDISGLRLAFGALMIVVPALLLYALFIRPMPEASRGLRAAMLPMTNGAAVGCGNLAFLSHALVFFVATLRRRGPWPLIATIVAVSLLKPVYLTYLLVFAYEDERFVVRARRIAAGVLLAAVAAALVLATGGPELATWRAALGQVALGEEVGAGFLNWTGHLGMPPTDRLTHLAYVAYAGVICLGGLAIAEARRLSAQARVLLALGLAQLVNPRLMSYDLPMLALLAVAFDAVPERWRGTFRTAALAIGGIVVLLQFSGVRNLVRLGPALLTGVLLASAALAVRDLLDRRALALAPAEAEADA